jgi:hypothetical protein
MKKYFLSIGLSIKFKYAEKLSDNISIAELFEKAKVQSIPPTQWYSFIIQELNLN